MTRALLEVGDFIGGPSVCGPAAGVRVSCPLPEDGPALADRISAAFPKARRGRGLADACVGLADALAGAVWGRRSDGRVLSVSGGSAELFLGCPRDDLAAPLVDSLGLLLRALRAGRRPPVDAALAPLLARRALPVAAFGLAEAAWVKGLPAAWPLGAEGPLVLGYGARRRVFHLNRIDGLATSDLIDDKLACASMLRAAGLPATRPVQVGDVEEAVSRAREVGFPVVLKPRLGRAQVGVWTGLRDEAAVAFAFERARAQAGPLGGPLLLEAHHAGRYVRATLVGGRVVAALTARPPTLVADGVSDLEALLRARFETPVGAIWSPRDRGVFEAALAAQGFGLASVPRRGQRLRVGLDGHGALEDITDVLHPSLRACLAAVGRLFPQHVLAVELLMRRPAGPLDPARDVIFEVNAAPDFTLHEGVTRGEPRELSAAVIAHLFPRGAARVPVVAAGHGGARALREVARALSERGVRCGGYVDGVAWSGASAQTLGRGAGAERLAAMDESAEVLLIEVDEDMALRRGLPFDRVDLRVGERHAGPVDAVLSATQRQVRDVEAIATRAIGAREKGRSRGS